MGNVMLTLQVPMGGRGLPVVATASPDALQHFRRIVLAEAQRKVEEADDEIEALLARLEQERVTRALAVLIPRIEYPGVRP